MALSKKGSRAISVAGDEYRWAYSFDSGFSLVVVQLADGAGQKLTVYIHWSRVNYSFCDANGKLRVTPGLVSAMIIKAKKAGWEPAEQGANFSCDLLVDESLKVRSGS